MSLITHSRFYYGFEVTPNNNLLNFDEGSGELEATIPIGSYTATEFAAAIQAAMRLAGAFEYLVAFNRTTRLINISTAASNFSLLPQTGTNSTSGPWALMGFTTDTSGSNDYDSDGVAGSQYVTQFIIQDHVSTRDWKEAREANVNKSASGRVEVIKFGDDSFLQANLRYVTDITQPSGGPITSNATGVADLNQFMNYLISKGPVEYMADKDNQAVFEKLVLESTPQSSDGVGYRLKELYDIDLPEYFETGILKFRAVE